MTVGVRAMLAASLALGLGACAHGGGKAPAAGLLPSAWVAQSIAGKPVVGHAVLTLVFDETGKVSGMGGCNRYAGQATVAGTALTFGPLVSTRMACTSGQLNIQETRYLAVLGGAQSYVIDRDGWLVISSQGEKKPSRLAPDPRPRDAAGPASATP